MSVLIKGMEMPKCCDECFALDEHGDYPYCLISQDQRGYTFNTREKKMPSCPLIEVPKHEFARCTCEDSIQENGINLISEWATKGIDLAGEYGKTIDDLIVFLKAAYGMKMLFDLIGKQPKDVSDEHTD